MCFVLPPDDAVGYDDGDCFHCRGGPSSALLGSESNPALGAEEATAHMEPPQSYVPRLYMILHRQGLGDARSRPTFPS